MRRFGSSFQFISALIRGTRSIASKLWEDVLSVGKRPADRHFMGSVVWDRGVLVSFGCLTPMLHFEALRFLSAGHLKKKAQRHSYPAEIYSACASTRPVSELLCRYPKPTWKIRRYTLLVNYFRVLWIQSIEPLRCAKDSIATIKYGSFEAD